MPALTPFVNRFDVWLVEQNPTRGSEIAKTRPSVVVSPEVANRHLRTVLVVSLTSTFRNYPTRLTTQFQGRPGELAFDQLRAVDRTRLVRRLGQLDDLTAVAACATLQRLFAY